MGGNALKLKGFEAQRVLTEKALELSDNVQTKLISLDIFTWIKPVKYYHQKKDHGDIDFVASLKQNCPPNWTNKCTQALSSKAHHWNKPVISLEYQGVQIDITGRDTPEKATTTLEFCHYSPLGNILGRMIRKTGAKWGIDGLQYPIYEANTPLSPEIKCIDLTHNIKDILEFCGLDYQTWEKGFETQEDIFSFATQSPLFDKKIFLIENLNHTHRKRDRTRQDYHNWLEFIKTSKNNISWQLHESTKEYKERVEYYQKILNEKFPESNLLTTQKTLREEVNTLRNLKKTKFNGNLVALWTGIHGENLGVMISNFKKTKNISGKKEFDIWIEKTDKHQCKMQFLEFFEKTKNKPQNCNQINALKPTNKKSNIIEINN